MASAFDPFTVAARPGCRPHPGQLPAIDKSREQPVGDSDELRRVLALPRRPALGDDPEREAMLVEAVTARWRRADEEGPCRCAELRPTDPECVLEANGPQAFVLHEVSVIGGQAGLIGVGIGKTFLNYMAAMALADHGVQTTLLLYPGPRGPQYVAEHRLYAEHWQVPSARFDTESYKVVFPNRPRVVAVPYGQLSRPGFTAYLSGLKPDAIIADEAHHLRNFTASVTKRVDRYLKEHPWCKFLWWTGSSLDAKLRDIRHLMEWALGQRSPLPLSEVVGDDWGRAVDARKQCAAAGELWRFCDYGEHVRDGVRRRQVETLGVTATTSPAVDCEIEVEPMPDPEMPQVVADALELVREAWERPDGESLVDALEVARVARDVACGYYLYWTFPRGETDRQIEAWLEARKLWRKELRKKLKRGEEHLDSPRLLEDAAERYYGRRAKKKGLPEWASEYWEDWDRVRRTVQPETEVEWIDDYLARASAAWALEERGIVWYSRVAFGQRVAKIAGLPMFGAGRENARLLLREDGSRSIVVSARAHGVGTNGLQLIFDQALVSQHESSNTAWEQLIGRLARQRQRSRVVRHRLWTHTDELQDAYDEARRRAAFVKRLSGSEQNLTRAKRGPSGARLVDESK